MLIDKKIGCPHLGQWELVTAIPGTVRTGGGIIDFFQNIFGRDSGVDKGRQKRIGTSISGGQSILAGIQDLPQLITNIENFLSGKTSWFGCPPGTTGTTGRGCYVAACKMAVSLGWQSQHYADCHPYFGDERYNPNPPAWATFVIAERDLKRFYRGILPKLKAEQARRVAPIIRKPVIIPPTVITQPSTPIDETLPSVPTIEIPSIGPLPPVSIPIPIPMPKVPSLPPIFLPPTPPVPPVVWPPIQVPPIQAPWPVQTPWPTPPAIPPPVTPTPSITESPSWWEKLFETIVPAPPPVAPREPFIFIPPSAPPSAPSPTFFPPASAPVIFPPAQIQAGVAEGIDSKTLIIGGVILAAVLLSQKKRS